MKRAILMGQFIRLAGALCDQGIVTLAQWKRLTFPPTSDPKPESVTNELIRLSWKHHLKRAV